MEAPPETHLNGRPPKYLATSTEEARVRYYEEVLFDKGEPDDPSNYFKVA